jgi:hypothetical protein
MIRRRKRAVPGPFAPRGARRRALVLVLVLVVIAVISLSAYAFTDVMLAHHESAQLSGRQVQARALADSGVDAIRVFLSHDPALRRDLGGIHDNPDRFRGQLVFADDNPLLSGRFTAVSPRVDEEGFYAGLRFGLENESARLNLNSLLLAENQAEDGGRTLLMALPGMTEEIADAILDWIDPDSEPRTFGAEVDFYSGLSPPYGPRNGPLESVEELLLVRGVTPDLLFGRDINRNGIVDEHEQGLPVAAGLADNSDGSLDRGWSAYLTLYSMELNVDAAGLPRINLAMQDMQQLFDELSAVFPPEWATFIVAYRQEGRFTGSAGENAAATAARPLDLTRPGKYPITQVLDLIGVNVRVKFQGDEQPTVIPSPFVDSPPAMGAYLPRLMDAVTVNKNPIIPGRININEAPRAVLLGIPGMNEEIVGQILARRRPESEEDQPNRRFETWILAEAIVTLDEMRALMPLVTAGGNVHRAQVVGYTQGGGPAARVEVVVDATTTPPRVLFWRDMSHLGRGLPLETLGIEAIETTSPAGAAGR